MSLLEEVCSKHKKKYIKEQYPQWSEEEFDLKTTEYLPLDRRDLKNTPFAFLFFLGNTKGGWGEKVLKDYWNQTGEYWRHDKKADGYLDGENIEIKTSLVSKNDKMSFNQVRENELVHYCLCFVRLGVRLLKTTGRKLRQTGGKPSKSTHKQCHILENKLHCYGEFIAGIKTKPTVDCFFEEG